MAIIDDGSVQDAQTLAADARRASVALRPYEAGSAKPGLAGGATSPDEVDAAVQKFLDTAAGIGYTAPLPSDQAIVTDGTELPVTGGTVILSVVDGEVSAEFVPDPEPDPEP